MSIGTVLTETVLTETVTEGVPPGLLGNEELQMALANAALFFDQGTRSDDTRRAVKAVLETIQVTPEQTRVLTDSINIENEVLRKLGAGEE